MKRKALFRAVIVACSMLAPALQLQADPIADALKLIRQSAKSSVKKQTFKKIAPTVPVEASIAAATQLQYQEAALLLYKRQFNKNGEFTKDSNNPVLHHALAMLPNEKEPFSSIQHSFDALRHWASIAKDKKGNNITPKQWAKYKQKYQLTYHNTDTLLFTQTNEFYNKRSNSSLNQARSILSDLQMESQWISSYQDQIQRLEVEAFQQWQAKQKNGPDTSAKAPKFESITLKAYQKRIETQLAFIDQLEFDSLMQTRNIAALSARRTQLLAIKKPNAQTKVMIQRAEDTLVQWEFELASAEDQEQSYRRFLAQYPKAPQKNAILQRLEGLAFERAQQLNTVEAYEQFLKSQLPPPLQRNDLTFRAQFLLRSLTVKPIPIAYNKTKEPFKEGFYFADSATLQPWMELDFKMAYPYALNNYHNHFVESGATLIPGCALVMRTDTFGLIEFSYITKDGKPFTKNNYETIFQFSSTMAFVQRGGRWGILNHRGKELLPCKFENLRYDTATKRGALQLGKKWALFNETGKLITTPKFDAIGFETWENEPTEAPAKLWVRNRCAAKINDNWALIDTLGNSLTPFAYESMTTLPFGRFMGKINDGYCLWRDTIRCSAEYAEAVDFGKPYTLVQQAGWGIIDTLGKILVPPIYEKSLLVGSTIALLKNKKWNFYYSKGEFSLPIKGTIDDFRLYGDGMVYARQKKNWILYHAFTKTVRKVKSIDLQQLTDTLLLEPIGSYWFITHANGKVLLKDTLMSLSRINDHEWFATKPSLNGTTLMGLLCLPSMQWSLKPQYQEIILSQKPSHYMVKKNDRWGVVNNFGEVIVPIAYDAITDTEFPGYWYALKGEQTLWIDASGRELSQP
jgi:hypothetical protein